MHEPKQVAEAAKMQAYERRLLLGDTIKFGMLAGGGLAIASSILLPIMAYASLSLFIDSWWVALIMTVLGLLLGYTFGCMEGMVFLRVWQENGGISIADRGKRSAWRVASTIRIMAMTAVAWIMIYFTAPFLLWPFLFFSWWILVLFASIPIVAYCISDIVFVRHCKRAERPALANEENGDRDNH
ncbi:MAG TPA: hypothetical protein VGK19_20590 [Capsulimonadaceae bacterium]|jgi:hypothetical protein